LKYDGHSELLKAAPKRLRDAQELLEEPTLEPHGSDADCRHLCGACYLAGYAVECVLKAYVIRLLAHRTSQHLVRWSQAIVHFDGVHDLHGAASHNLARLLVVSELAGELDADPQMKRVWSMCVLWRPDWRYLRSNGMGPAEARQFVDACAAAHDWVRQRLHF
jgi:hypothetical protein